MTSVSVAPSSGGSETVECIVIGIAKGADGPVAAPGAEAVAEAFGGRLPRILGTLHMTGAEGETLKLPAPAGLETEVVLAVGLGDLPEEGSYGTETLRRAAGVAARALEGAGRAVLSLPVGTAEAAEAVALGGLLGSYAFTAYRADGERPVRELVIAATGGCRDDLATGARRGIVIGEELNRARDLVNMPANDLTPETFAALVREAAETYGLDVEVLDEKALAEGRFGGILGVGQGSIRPPRLVRVAHRHPAARTSLAFVGKGITYDSGGISLKPVGFNEIMKRDMAGAAAVFAAVIAAARLGLHVDLTGWLALAENMPSGSATRPGDVLRIYGGTTVEVLNTDAEGRLVLADTLVRAGEDRPDAIVDVATLTAAMKMALGDRVFGVMSDDDAFRDRVVDAAERSGEQAWPMPLPNDLRQSLNSRVADLANTGARMGGGLVAGLFLREFVPDGTPWAHLDIAGPAYNEDAPHGYTPQGATGTAMRTLVQLAQDVVTGDAVQGHRAPVSRPAVSRPMPLLEQIRTDEAPEPFGHYAQATVAPDGTIRVSAQLPVGDGVSSESTVAEQARQALSNVVSIVEAAGGTLTSVARVALYLADIGDWESVDAVFGEVFGGHRPARAMLQVAGLHQGFRVAAEAVASSVR